MVSRIRATPANMFFSLMDIYSMFLFLKCEKRVTGIEETSEETLRLVKKINAEIDAMTAEIKEKLPKIYSKELIDLLFYEFYTRIQYVQEGLEVSRRTAVTYLGVLEKEGFLVSEKIGKERIYQNKRLYDLVKSAN